MLRKDLSLFSESMPRYSYRNLRSHFHQILRQFSSTSRRRRGVQSVQAELLETRVLLTTLHVDALALAGGDGSAAAPFKTVQAGINAAAAIAGDDTVLIEPGVYNESLLVNDSSGALDVRGNPGITAGVTIDGGGQDVFQITPHLSVTVADLNVVNGDRGILAQDGAGSLTIDGVQGANFARSGFVSVDTSAFTIRNSSASNATYGVFSARVPSVIVENTILTQNRIDGAQIQSTSSLLVSDVTASNNPWRGVSVFAATGTTTFNNVTAADNGIAGIGVFNGRTNLVITDSSFTNNAFHGIDIGGVTDATISNVVVAGNGSPQGGAQTGGAGIRAQTDLSTARIRIEDSLIENNSEGFFGGGGVMIAGATSAIIERTTIRNNSSATSIGGGILLTASGSASVIRDSVIEGNSGTFGGGIYYSTPTGTGGGALLIERTTIDSNTSTGDNGEQFAPADGGGVFVWNRTLTIRDSTISNNVADSGTPFPDPASGGGLAIQASTVTVQNSTISGNEAGLNGGGVAIHNGNGRQVRFLFATIADNVAGGEGGGIYRDAAGDLPWLGNTIVATNSASSAPDFSGALGDFSFNLIGDATGSTGANSSLIGTTANPVDPVIGPLSNNGGATETHELLPTSPAIDAVGATNFPLTTDQRGVPRPQGNQRDIGAFERAVPLPLSLTVRATSLNETGSGTSTSGFVSRPSNSDLSAAVTVTLTSSDTNELSVPVSTIIPAGATTSAFFSVTAVDDGTVDGDKTVIVTASAPGFFADTDSVIVVDTTPPNTPPVANNQNLNVGEDSQLSGTLTAFDADGDATTFQLVSGPANHFAFTFISNGSFSYTPLANFNGSDSFTFRAFDGTDYSDPATISIEVLPVNDAPTAGNDSSVTSEDQAVVIDVLNNDGDVDGDQLTVAIGTNATSGLATVNADGTITYTPNPNFNGSDSFTYTTNDGNGGIATATVDVSVTPVNDAPVDFELSGSLVNENVDTTNSVLIGVFSASDVDNDPLSFVLVAGVGDGDRFVVTGSELRLRAGEVVDFETQPSYSITASVTDGAATRQQTFVIAVVDDSGAPSIDVVPGSEDNVLSKKFDVAFLSSTEFDATTRIDISTLTAGKTGLEDSLARNKKSRTIKFRLEDVNNDGLLDLIVTVETKKTGLSSGDTELRIQGLTSNGDAFELNDTVTVGRGKGKGGGKGRK